jgi:superfamily I DNA and/or RNA helicase
MYYRTLDNFQGEEGEVIILSLVRNSGTPFDGKSSSLQYTGARSPIGFLKVSYLRLCIIIH